MRKGTTSIMIYSACYDLGNFFYVFLLAAFYYLFIIVSSILFVRVTVGKEKVFADRRIGRRTMFDPFASMLFLSVCVCVYCTKPIVIDIMYIIMSQRSHDRLASVRPFGDDETCLFNKIRLTRFSFVVPISAIGCIV